MVFLQDKIPDLRRAYYLLFLFLMWGNVGFTGSRYGMKDPT
jgi:hypothetical protein